TKSLHVAIEQHLRNHGRNLPWRPARHGGRYGMNASRMSTLVCLLSFLASISHAQLTFDHTSAPGSMTILADLNDDGLPDAVGVPDPEHLVVQLNGGGGHFLAPVTYTMKNNKGISGITVTISMVTAFPTWWWPPVPISSSSAGSVIPTATPMEC